jgi:hypothetical protein
VEKRRFCKYQVTRRVSVARRATFDNWRLAAEEGSQVMWPDYKFGLLKRGAR